MHQIYLASFVGIRGIEPRSKPYESSVINHYTISPNKEGLLYPHLQMSPWTIISPNYSRIQRLLDSCSATEIRTRYSGLRDRWLNLSVPSAINIKEENVTYWKILSFWKKLDLTTSLKIQSFGGFYRIRTDVRSKYETDYLLIYNKQCFISR